MLLADPAGFLTHQQREFFFLVLANFSFYVPHTDDDDDVTAQRDNSCPYIRVTVEERPTTVGS